MDALPAWLINSSETPTKILGIFQEKVQILLKNQTEKAINLQIEELIKMGGILNQSTLANLLPKSLRIVYLNCLKTKDQRFQQITENCLPDFKIEGREPRLDQIKHLYSKNHFYNVIQEIGLYLLSQPMPLQTTKLLGYYEVTLFKNAIDARHEKLMKTIAFIFEMTQTKEALEETINSMLTMKCEAIDTKKTEYLIQVTSDKQAFREFLSLEQEHFLFKYAALIGQSYKVSWVYFFYYWAKQSSYGKPLVELMDKHFCFDKFLVQDKEKLMGKKTNRTPSNISAQSYLINQTTHFIFKTKTSVIPRGKWETDLKKQFAQSEDIRQNMMYYIDYLDSLWRKTSENLSIKIEANALNKSNGSDQGHRSSMKITESEPSKKSFSFDKAISKLNEYFPDKTLIYYQFPHAALHFFCYNSFFIVPPTEECKAALFKRFYWMKLEDRLFLDKYIASGKPIIELISTGFPNSPQIDSLKKDILKFLGEERIQEIDQVLKLLPSFTDDQNGTLLSAYIEFIETANRAKEASEKAIEKGEATADEIILKLANCRKKLDLHNSKNEEIIDLYLVIYHKCVEKFTLSAALKQLINIIGSSPTKKTREQFIFASAEQEFLITLQEILKRYADAIDYDQKSFQNWVVQGEFTSTTIDEQEKLNRHLEVPLQDLINQLQNANQETSGVITYLNKIKNVLLFSIQHHQLVIQTINNLTLILSESIRRELIASLKTSEICRSFIGFFSSFPPSFPATEKDIVFFSSLTPNDLIRDLFRTDAWKISGVRLEKIVAKIKSKDTHLELTEQEMKKIDIIYIRDQCISESSTDCRLPKAFNKKLKNLKIISDFFRFFCKVEKFKVTMRTYIEILNRIKSIPQEDLIVDNVENKMTEEFKGLICKLKKFRSTDTSIDEINDTQKQCNYSLTQEQEGLLNPIYIKEIDDIVAHYMFSVDNPNSYSQYYFMLVDTLHNTFKENFGEVEVIDSRPLPTLDQLKFAIKLMQHNMSFLLASSFTPIERIAVAELLQILMLGKEKTKNVSKLTSEFAFTWKEVQNYTIFEELTLLPNKDILHSLLNIGSLKDETEKSRNQLVKCFFNDYHRSGITKMDIISKGVLKSVDFEEGEGFFESLRSAYFNFLDHNVDALKEEIIYNQNNCKFVLASITKEQFKEILLTLCLDGQSQKVEEIVNTTTFTHEQCARLKILSPETEKEILESLFRVKILQCLLFWNQAIAPMMLNQKIHLELDEVNLASVCSKVNSQDLFGNALGRIWVVDESLNSMRHTLIYGLKQAGEITTECTYSQTLSLINIASSNPEESKVTLVSVDTLYVGPGVDIKTFDKLTIALG